MLFDVIYKSRLVTVTVLLLFPLVSLAADELGEEDLYFDVPLTLTATRLPQSEANSPVSITTIDREMIEAYDPAELVDVLRLVPGFQVIHPKGHRASISYHGIADEFARRMQVLIDGRSVYSPLLGHVEWSAIPLEVEDIERIEVVRGPNAASYGANSFTAVVNIITRHPADVQGNYAKLKTGSVRTRKAVLRHAGNQGKLDYRMSLSYRGDEGFDDREAPDDKRISAFSLRGNYQLDAANDLEFQFGYASDLYQEGEPLSTILTTRRADNLSSFELLRWRRTISPTEEFSLQFYHNRQQIDDNFFTEGIDTVFGAGFAALVGGGASPTDQVFVSNSQALHRYDLEMQHRFMPRDDLRVVWGASARLDRTGSKFLFNRDSNRDYIDNKVYRLFGNAEWTASPKWTFNAGLMVENNDVTGTDISPRLSANYHLDKDHTFRVSASRALRTPSVFEVNGLSFSRLPDGRLLDQIFLPNFGLEPEKITSFELAYIGKLPGYGLNIDAKLFYDRIDDPIASYTDRDFNDPINALLGFPPNTIRGSVTTSQNNDDPTILKGIEAQLRYQPNRDTRVHLGYTIVRAKGETLKFINGGPLADATVFNDTEKEVPRTMGTLQVIHDLGQGFNTSLALHSYGRYDPKGGEATGDFTILNWRLAKKFKLAGSNMQVAGTFQNIADDYFDFAETRVFDNRVFLTLEASFD